MYDICRSWANNKLKTAIVVRLTVEIDLKIGVGLYLETVLAAPLWILAALNDRLGELRRKTHP